MSLRNNVFLLFSTLLIILLGSQWLIMRSVTQDLSRELGQVAFSVARDTASFFILGEFQWNDRLLFEQNNSSKHSVSDGNVQLEQNTTLVFDDNKNPNHSKSRKNEFRTQPTIDPQIFIYKPPSVEIRIDNQIEDDHIELITSTGTQSIPLQREGMNAMVSALEKRMLTGTLIILILGLIIAAYFSHRISAPLRNLSEAAESVASGDLGTTIKNEGRFISQEIRKTIASFNQMSKQLADVETLKARVRENEHYRELGEIARGLAHSIRNPLNTLGLTIEELSRNDLEDSRRNSLVESGSRQITRVDQWIRSFMTFSLSGDTQSSEINLLPIVQDIQLEASQSEGQNVKLNIEQSSSPIVIMGVEAEIKAILHALIINAVEASPEDGIVNINFAQMNDVVKVCISDEGNGLPEEIREKLFQPHQTTKAKGSGMGLYMAYRLATVRYDGKIDISDRKDTVGTIVELKLANKRVV